MLRSLGIGVRVTWVSLPGKPAVFPPASHTHAYADLTGIPATFAPSAHTHGWAEITGKPSLYPPSSHTHLWADITDKPTTFAPATHTHAGLLQLVGTVTVTETTLLALAVGMKRMTLTLAGITTADMGKLVVIPNGTATTGCEVQNAYPVAANSVSIGYYTPALGLAATYSIPIAVYRIT